MFQIFCCFGISMYSKLYLGYAVVALMAEVNSIFLHGRQLLLMCNTSKRSTFFIVNSVINIITFVLFRFGVLLWMAHWLWLNKHAVPPVLVAVATSGLVIMLAVNVVLFYRLLMSDFILRRGQQRKDILDKWRCYGTPAICKVLRNSKYCTVFWEIKMRKVWLWSQLFINENFISLWEAHLNIPFDILIVFFE